ncbi:MAG: hypothetical protein RIR19_204 [Chloroflexota bacterium]|jgi:uncharacterized protein YdhG (YjbR/CyaY superfamily)
MATRDPRREARFPAIEKRYGEPMSHWFKVMAKLEGKRYPEQMAHLQENHGFSREHANALVMFSRGSTSAQRFATPTSYFKSIDTQQARTIKAIFAAIKAKHPSLKLVIAWNKPTLQLGSEYVLGASTTKGYILINPFSKAVVVAMKPKMKGLRVLKHTVSLPNDWVVDAKLVQAMAKARISELK